LRRVEERVEAGEFAVGFIAYEAAPAFDRALAVRPAARVPLLWFATYARAEVIADLPPAATHAEVGEWSSGVTAATYHDAVRRVRAYLAAGDSYQVNYTARLSAPFRGDPLGFFRDVVAAQDGAYAAYIDTGDHVIASASPELFFRREGERLVTKPMKGTARRGLTLTDDREQARWLQASEKNRAENVMIVDMLRNDLGRIAVPGSVEVTGLFEVERYPTVWQMTSTVAARSAVPTAEVFRALFPCASITGAPKRRTMQIIAELEPDARGVYTGAVGFMAPGRQARFAVAIRTVTVDRAAGVATYGTGGAIVWDSDPADEYEEALLKARVLRDRRPDFKLLESLLWTPSEGYHLLHRHLNRMRDSAEYFDYAFDELAARAAVDEAVAFVTVPVKVRLLLASRGSFSATAEPMGESSEPVTLRLAAAPVDADDPFLYHKTTNRAAYESARASAGDVDDVVLWNARGEVTETAIANIAVMVEGEWVTPPVTCGLLAGTYRDELLAAGRISERVVTVGELRAASRIAVMNSVRGWREAALLPDAP